MTVNGKSCRAVEINGKVYHSVQEMIERIIELEAQVDKMKCCMNCKYFDPKEPMYCNKGVFNSYVCKKWEIL